jgi:hypothetical protein
MTLREPVRPGSLHPAIVEDLLEMASAEQAEAVQAAIEMLEDLVEHGLESRYAKKLHSLPIWELKTRSRGKEKVGTRVAQPHSPGNSSDGGALAS